MINNKTYVITDNNNNISGIYDSDINAFTNIMDKIINELVLLHKIKESYNNINIHNFLNNYEILCMTNNTNIIFKKYFFSFDKFNFLDNENIINTYNEYNYYFINKQNNIKQLYQQLSNDEINVFIPHKMTKIDSDLPTCTANNIVNALDTDYINENIINNTTSALLEPNNIQVDNIKLTQSELKKKIDDLDRRVNIEKEKTDIIKNKINSQEDKYAKKRELLNDKKKQLKLNQDECEEFTRKFYADKKVYGLIKNQIETNECTIPELFTVQYPLFKELDQKEKLDTNEELNEYIKIIPIDFKKRLSFIPSDKYAHLFRDNTEILSESSDDDSTVSDASCNSQNDLILSK